MNPSAVLIAVVTLVAGLAAGWALARTRTASEATATASEQAATRAERDAAVAERDRIAAERSAERDANRAEFEKLGRALRLAEAEVAAAGAKIEALENGETQLKDTFVRLSQEALHANRQQFLDLADDRFKQAGRPLTETLGKVERQLQEIEKERSGAQARMTQQIESVRLSSEQLKTETAALVSALRKPQARGRWGELQLRSCVDYAGMTNRCDFVEQESVATSDGLLRPDLVVKLVGGKSIVVDSKVTLAAYLEAHDAVDDAIREERLGAHARHLRQHVDALAAKAYWSQFSPSPEFVVLFVPGEAFLAPALERDPTLLEYAIGKRVHIATPTTLISMLRTIGYVWQQEALADNAQQVFTLGRELYKRLGTFGGHMDKLGRTLTSAAKTYNDAVGSLERNVLSQARKLNELEVVDAELAEPTHIEEPVRSLAAGELIVGAEQARPVAPLRDLGVSEPVPALEGRVDDYGIDAAAEVATKDRRTGS